jgi:hypothetical protein
MLQLHGLLRDETFQIFFVSENNVFRIKGEIFGVNIQVSLHIRGRREKLTSAFFDGFEVVLLYLGELRDFFQRDVSCLSFLS